MKNLLMLSVLLSGALSFADTPPVGVQIVSVTARGTGCADGSARALVAPDGRTFSVFMDNYTATADPGFTLDRKTCTVNVNVASPPGWSFTLTSADYRGFIAADAGTQVSHQVLYSFDGAAPPNERPGFGNSPGRYSFLQKNFNGPMNQDYYVQNVIDPRAQLWSSCSGGAPSSLMIQTFLIAKINAPNRQAQISLDTVDGILAQNFSWNWRKCATPSDPARNPMPSPPPGRGGRPPRFPFSSPGR